MYRANFQSRIIEEVFSQQKVPYHIEKGTTFYQRTEVRNLLDYLRVISNPESVEANDALLNILNVPTRYVSRKLSREIEEYAEERGISVYEALSSMRIEPVYVRRALRSFREFLNPLIEDAQTIHPSELLGLLRSTLDYDRFITDEDMPGPDDVKIQNLDQLQLAAARFRDIRV
ncbi:MAG: 3'-5' exonuclease [Candidatus Humimicrobiaceae bacterium]